jgi:hypothetical protein
VSAALATEGAVPGIEGLTGKARKEAVYKEVRVPSGGRRSVGAPAFCAPPRLKVARGNVFSRPASLDAQAFGEEYFDRDAKMYVEEGTRQNPIPVSGVAPSPFPQVARADVAAARSRSRPTAAAAAAALHAARRASTRRRWR